MSTTLLVLMMALLATVAAAVTVLVVLGLRRSRDRHELAPVDSREVGPHLSAWSHEIRGPLTTSLGHLDLLLEAPGVEPAHRAAVERAAVGIERAVALLHELGTHGGTKDPSHASAPGVEVDLDLLVREAVTDFGPLAGRRRVSISYDSPGPTTVVGDARRLRQVVDNLLSNAVKYADADGWVDVRTVRPTPAEGWGTVDIEVVNPGATLSVDEVERAFDTTFRGAGASARGEGLGMGLAVVREVVEEHAGEVSMEVTDDPSTTVVRVRLPGVGHGPMGQRGPRT